MFMLIILDKVIGPELQVFRLELKKRVFVEIRHESEVVVLSFKFNQSILFVDKLLFELLYVYFSV